MSACRAVTTSDAHLYRPAEGADVAVSGLWPPLVRGSVTSAASAVQPGSRALVGRVDGAMRRLRALRSSCTCAANAALSRAAGALLSLRQELRSMVLQHHQALPRQTRLMAGLSSRFQPV